MAVAIQADTPLAAQLSSVVQPKLVELGWSTGGPDDSALAEYIILMLVNGKNSDQIASELSNDLLSLGPEDQIATDFATWLFQQVEALQNPNGATSQSAPSDQTAPTQAIPSFTGDHGVPQQQNDSVFQDAEMGDVGDNAQGMNIPTGPKNMRGKPNGKRLVGQLNRAMDRTNENALHRVRGGSTRINSHDRQPPRGPRASGALSGFAQGPPAGPMRGGAMGGRGGRGGMNNNVQMSQQQQAQLMQLMEEQARMMSSLLSPQQQQMMMGGMNAPAINPNFRGNQQGRSLFDRVQRSSNNNRGGRQNGNGQSHKPDTQMGDDTAMDMDDSSKKDLGPDTICKFNLKCTKSDCSFAHQSPAAPPGTSIDVNDTCSFGAACQNRKCTGRHPSPAIKKSHQADQDCKFFPNCTNPTCPFKHPDMPVCRFGSACTKPDCKFTHVQTKCKYTPCLNPTCIYKHDEGQKKSTVWTKDGAGKREHVSERKFTADADGPEELIVGGSDEMGENLTGQAQDVVT